MLLSSPNYFQGSRAQAPGSSCHPIKLNNLQVLGGSTCEQLAEQIHLLQDAGPALLLQSGCALLPLPRGVLPRSSQPGAGVPIHSELGKSCFTPGSCNGGSQMGFSHSASALCVWRGSVQCIEPVGKTSALQQGKQPAPNSSL